MPSNTVAHHTEPFIAVLYNRVYVITEYVIAKFYCILLPLAHIVALRDYPGPIEGT